jgi:hypothetical protein
MSDIRIMKAAKSFRNRPLEYRLEECPCGCKKFMLAPGQFNWRECSMPKPEAEQVAFKLNNYDYLHDLADKLMNMVAESIVHGMPVTDEVAITRNNAVAILAEYKKLKEVAKS